jgi:Flp pilus assembly protein TadG
MQVELSKKSGKMLRRWRSWRAVCNDEGATIVEMALACTILIAIMFGILELSLGLYTYNYVSDAAREATRYAIVRGSSCSTLTNCSATSAQIQTYVQDLGYPGINSTNTTVTTTWYTPSTSPPTTWTVCTTGTCNAPGSSVKVKVSFNFPLGVPFLRFSSLTLQSTSQMVIAN